MNKLLTLTAAGALLSASALNAQIEINENLSVTGFIDMSAGYADTDLGSSTHYDVDQVELDFLLSFDKITAQIDIDFQPGQADELELEQAFLTYDLGEGQSLTFGKFLSYHGWETAEPTGLYQYSVAYSAPTIPGYHNGIAYDVSTDWGSFGIALLDGVYGEDGGLANAGGMYEYGLEAKLTFTPAEGLTLYFGYALDEAEEGFESRSLFNFWSSYETGAHTFAVEYNMFEGGDFDTGLGDLDIDQWLAMWNVKVSDKGSVTLRVSDEQIQGLESGPTIVSLRKYTAAYLHTVTDNLALVFEISDTDIEGASGTEFAVEALFTF